MPNTTNLRSAFDPGAVKMLTLAFDDAWSSLKVAHSIFADQNNARRTRDILARRIIEGAEHGERSPTKLRDYALARFAESH